MTDYYCDLDTDFVANRDGTDTSTNVLTSVAGLQTICNGWDSGNVTQLDAGDNLYAKGTARLDKWIRITVDVDKSSTWTIGDAVRNYNDGGGTAGDDWVGTLAYINATTLWVWLTTGVVGDVDTADGVDNTTQVDQIAGTNMTAASAPGWIYDGNSGDSTSGMIRLIGANSSFTRDGTLAVFDGNDATTNCFYPDVGLAGSRVEHMRFTRAINDGVEYGVTSETHFLYCKSDNNGAMGFSVYSGDKLFYHCIVRGNGSTGFYRGYTDSAFIHCVVSDTDGTSLDFYFGGSAINCLITNGGGHGIFVGNTDGSMIANCTIDGCSSSGIYLATNQDNVSCVFNRITNSGSYGIASDNLQHTTYIDRYNYFYGNTSGDVEASDDAEGSYYHADTTEEGYVDMENRDYDVKPEIPLCSEKLLLEWDL
jgi:parallel beta-helix repeat protein